MANAKVTHQASAWKLLSDGAVTLSVNDQANWYQIYIETDGTLTAGTFAITGAYTDSQTFVAVSDEDGAAISFTFDDLQAQVASDAVFAQIKVTPSGLVPTTVKYRLHVCSRLSA